MAKFERTLGLIGEDGMEKLKKSRILLFGVGGVGGYVAEALVRSGVGYLDLVDGDIVAESNINRQIVALTSTIGQYKAEVFATRAKDINPDAKINFYNVFFDEKTAGQFDFSAYDYVVDAIDDVPAKVEIITRSFAVKTPVISAMGAGNKLNPSFFRIADISKTSVCPLARVMRRKLRERGILHCKVIYSIEEPHIKHTPPYSMAFVPSVAGLMIAGEVIRDITGIKSGEPRA